MAIARPEMADLRALVRGRVLVPADADYEAARRPFNALSGGRPLAIVRPVDTRDILAALGWAEAADVGIGVRGGGHSVAGHSSPDGALLVDLSGWRGADVDPVARTADALGGSLLMDLDAATAAYGLAAPSGTFVDTGIGGLTLSGGISYLVASEGLACDALIGAELVTAAGAVIDVDEEREPDLLWALRGGGGNFGVVTRLRYRLTPVPEITAGVLRFAGDGLDRVLRRTIEIDAEAPDELTLQAVAGRSPDDGRPALSIVVAWRGSLADGEAAVAGLLEDPSPYESTLRSQSWLQVQAKNAPLPFGLRHYWKGHLLRAAGDDVVDAVLGAAADARGSSFVLLELLHGAVHRVPASSAAFGGRAAVANATGVAVWQDAADDDAQVAWARATAARFEPSSLRGGGYLNYPELDQSASRVAAAFGPEAFERLRQLKRRHDPANRFRFNGNIPPAA
jgi:FAD/FMN-containing dehydrogenase